MIRNIILATAILFSESFSSHNAMLLSSTNSGEQMVYVCTKSSAAYAYHTYSDCRHIKRCHEEGHIEKMSVAKAKKMQRTLCKTCEKRNPK